MRPFAYARAESLDEATAAAGEPGTVVLSGGTELLNWLRLGVTSADRVIDVSRVAGLADIVELDGGGLRIGAAAKLNDVAAHPRVAADWPALAESLHRAASAQLRNLASLGGNLLQKTRCPYFRAEEPVPCNRREPGSGCSALHGISDHHAVFGWTEECGATFPADPPVALAALDAVVVIRGTAGSHRVPVAELYVLPTDRVDADTVLAPGDVVEAIELGAPAPRSAYVKVRERASYEYAMVSAAAAVDLADDGTIATGRLALGSVAMGPWRLPEAEAQLRGLRPDSAEATAAVAADLAGARAFGQSGYKVRLAAATARRALLIAAGVGP